MGCCDICSTKDKSEGKTYEGNMIKTNLKETHKKLIEEKLKKGEYIENESNIYEFDKNTKISKASIESEKRINGDFLY